MVAIVVTGMGLVSALGKTAASTWQRLLAGDSAIAFRQPFPELPPRPLAMVAKTPQPLTPLLLTAVAAALQDAGLQAPLPACGVVIGSSRAYQGQWEQWGQSPELLASRPWLASLPSMLAVQAARHVGSQDRVLAPMAACATGLWAIAQGVDLIQQGYCQRVMVGAAEAAVTPMTLAGFEQMRAMAPEGCYPFDRDRQGLVVGEGAAILVLETASLAKQRSARVYGQVMGAGLTADAYHLSAPDPHGSGGLTAIQQCLTRSQLRPEQVGFIHAHGTGTHLNDAYESALIQRCFPHFPAVSSTKGATGHTLGASGAVGAVMCLLALHHQTVPPCVGLSQPAFPLNFVRQQRAIALQAALCFSFGFGGQNAVVAFKRWGEAP
jgi:3-oxoacyl-[acyl-carrier-protein] synthase II